MYDARAQELNDAADGEMNGVIGESDAREAWFAAIDDLQERGDVDAVAAGWEIAIALGWERSPEGEGEDDR